MSDEKKRPSKILPSGTVEYDYSSEGVRATVWSSRWVSPTDEWFEICEILGVNPIIDFGNDPQVTPKEDADER